MNQPESDESEINDDRPAAGKQEGKGEAEKGGNHQVLRADKTINNVNDCPEIKYHTAKGDAQNNDLTWNSNQTIRIRSQSVGDVNSTLTYNHVCCCQASTGLNTPARPLPSESISVTTPSYPKHTSPGYPKPEGSARKTSTVNWGPIYKVPVFAQNYSQNIEANNRTYIMPISGKGRRHSKRVDDENGDDNEDDQRRSSSSVGHILFGNPNSRRFSQDLWNLKLPEEETEESDSETTKVIFFQVFIPFLIAGFGNVGAGLILDYVQNWEVFRNVNGLYVLVASFLGFKGNLEMTLAARLSTQANMGKMDLIREQIKIATGNIALIQCQAIVVAFLAAIIAICSASIKVLEFDLNKSIVLLSTSLVTASVTGLFLASVMVIVVVISRKTNVNPDNVSTLIAAFLGDVTAVIIIAASSVFFYTYNSYWLSGCVIIFFILLLPVFSWIARKNEYTHEVVGTGWLPIILAMIISSLGGFIFDYAVDQFRSIALFQPIINGVGSNLVAVQASRISTYFHQRTNLGEFPATSDHSKFKICEMPHKAFFGSSRLPPRLAILIVC